jgi:hypothetical protein
MRPVHTLHIYQADDRARHRRNLRKLPQTFCNPRHRRSLQRICHSAIMRGLL